MNILSILIFMSYLMKLVYLQVHCDKFLYEITYDAIVFVYIFNKKILKSADKYSVILMRIRPDKVVFTLLVYCIFTFCFMLWDKLGSYLLGEEFAARPSKKVEKHS